MGMSCTEGKKSCNLTWGTYKATSEYDDSGDVSKVTIHFPATATRTLYWRVWLTDGFGSSSFVLRPRKSCYYTFFKANLAKIEMW